MTIRSIGYTVFSLMLATAVACKKTQEPAPAAAGSGSGSGSAGMAQGAAGSGSAGSGSPAASAEMAKPPAPYTPAADVPQPIRDAIAADDRSPADRQIDAGRKPGEVLAFFGIAPGQKVGELFAGGGYTTELMARTVGDSGKVYAENTKDILDKFARKPWSERTAKPINKNVVSLERPIDDPFGTDVKNLDAVVTILNYHDTVNMKADRAKMNKAVFDALKPGGVYGIVDSSAAAGTGTRDTDSLHRIDEDVVKKEVTAAGFKLEGESDALRNASDTRDWNSSPRAAGERRGTSDRFLLKFTKPKT
jgi:predicted methyltransferase